MQFPRLNKQERATNKEAATALTPGTTYRFEPPVTASGIPVEGPKVCASEELTFARGWYIGFREERHVFQGKPIEDTRLIDDGLRECYFHVDFVGGSSAIPEN